MANLLHPHQRLAIAELIKSDIDEYCRVTYDDGHRSHLGASMIGKECNRYMWYVFRWVQGSQFDGRMQRLFNRGHLEELRWIEWLRGIGFTIYNEDENGHQFRIAAVEGHFGGSLDSVGISPTHKELYALLSSVGPILIEYKTYSDKQFKKLQKDKVKLTKPEHWAQMCEYGYRKGIKYALYCPINKNDDDIAPELVELDWKIAIDAEKRAEFVITSPTPPTRFSEFSVHQVCTYCDFKDVCHNGKPYELNCRSCDNAVPVKGGEWYCKLANNIIPKDFLPLGCSSYTPVGRTK